MVFFAPKQVESIFFSSPTCQQIFFHTLINFFFPSSKNKLNCFGAKSNLVRQLLAIPNSCQNFNKGGTDGEVYLKKHSSEWLFKKIKTEGGQHI